jgi:hypothetical protein
MKEKSKMADPKYLDGVFANKKTFSNGGSVTKVSIKKDRLIEWLKNAPEHKEYIKCQIQGSREPKFDDYGNEKLIFSLDSYFYPDLAAPSQEQPQNYQQSTPAPQIPEFDPDETTDSIPF